MLLSYLETLKKIILLAGLLFFSVFGLIKLPDVAIHLWPDKFWSEQISFIENEYVEQKMRQNRLTATIAALMKAAEIGLPHLDGYHIAPDLAGIEKALQRCQAEKISRDENIRELKEQLQRLVNLKSQINTTHP